MKRKRGSGKRKPKKLSVTRAADIFVDPGSGSPVNEKHDRLDSRTEIETRDVSNELSGRCMGLDVSVIDNGTVGSAAAKLARAISSHTIPAGDRVPLQQKRICEKEPKSSHQEPLYKKQELEAAHSVIKKIMKMDAAVPFNQPVDPIALGIPDYFDIIETPMDFGTICTKLENGVQYRNSVEVFKDVQRIWDNCCKYNKKGSYILELMKRVKSTFLKQWTAAGFYKEPPSVSNEPTMRHQEAVHIHPVGTTIGGSAYLEQHDRTLLNQRQCQQLSPCCSHTFKPQQTSPHCPCSLHSGQLQPGHHQHDLAPQQNHYTHSYSGDLVNGKCCNQRVNEANLSIVHSCQTSPSCRGHGSCMHHSSASQLPPSQIQAGINTPSAGRLHVAHREPATTSNMCRHAFNSCGLSSHEGLQYQMDSIHMQLHHPSASCMPGDQLNQSTCHQLQSSRAEGSRNIDYAGNLRIPRPTESAANCSKHDVECSRPPIADNTSCQELNQMNSTAYQSSSMINVEACQPLENTCQNQPESSPSNRLPTRADDDNFSKSKTRGQELMQCQEQSSSMMNNQGRQSLENNCQLQTAPQSRTSTPSADHNRELKKKSRGRGPTQGLVFREGAHIRIDDNGQGQPVGPQVQKLVTFLGSLARNGHFLPLTYLDWRHVPSENKENLWEKVQSRFDIDPMCRHWVLQTLSVRWKSWKSKLKTAHYFTHETDEERLADRDERVLPDQWAALIKLWNTESAQKSSARNRANRMHNKYIHATGRKSFALIREELRASRPDGREPSRAELFILTRTRKNGKPVNEASSEVITKLRRQVKGQDVLQDDSDQGDLLSEILGPDKRGRTRCIELGPSPSDLGGEKPTHDEAAKTMSDAANAEIREMKEKMAAMEQACAQMASQMAAMMSMMSSTQRSTPDTVATTSGHLIPPGVETGPSPDGGSVRPTRRSTRNISKAKNIR